uniref:Miff domain-containing protein n=2 Tax=Caenorhabditis tropicalis TaxID=1561998 RepID=A0A1I7UC33_9PELO
MGRDPSSPLNTTTTGSVVKSEPAEIDDPEPMEQKPMERGFENSDMGRDHSSSLNTTTTGSVVKSEPAEIDDPEPMEQKPMEQFRTNESNGFPMNPIIRRSYFPRPPTIEASSSSRVLTNGNAGIQQGIYKGGMSQLDADLSYLERKIERFGEEKPSKKRLLQDTLLQVTMAIERSSYQNIGHVFADLERMFS